VGGAGGAGLQKSMQPTAVPTIAMAAPSAVGCKPGTNEATSKGVAAMPAAATI
jgi:hypothetical protein